MDKKILSFKALEPAYDTIMFQEQVIKVKKRLSTSDISTLVEGYIREYFSESEAPTQVVFAELSFKSILFDIVTDVEISENDFSEIIKTSLFDDVAEKVVNLKDVRFIIEKTIEKIEKENSIENTVKSIGDKLMETLENLSSMNLDQSLVDNINKTIGDIRGMNIAEEIPVASKKKPRVKKK